MRSLLLIPLVLSALSACSARQSDPPPGSGPAAYGPNYDPTQISVPFLVDDQFIPSGCMGDCATNVTIDSDCPQRGAVDAQGECHHFVFTRAHPTALVPEPFGWAGVIWQTTEKNWGSLPGRSINPGATRVQFFAAGAVGGEQLNILIGGLVPSDAGAACVKISDCSSGVCERSACTAAPHRDSLNLVQPLTLGAGFEKIEIPFGDSDYGSEVLSGFGWLAQMPANVSRIEFYVDDIRWE